MRIPLLPPSELSKDHKRIQGIISKKWESETKNNKIMTFIKLEGDLVYSKFGHLDAEEGDEILFDYEITNYQKDGETKIGHNIKIIQCIWNLEPIDGQGKTVQEPEQSQEKKGSMSKENSFEAYLHLAELLTSSIQWATKNNLEDKEIIPFYQRMLKECGLFESYQDLIQLNSRRETK
jgi:hypothetical protein